MFSSPFVPMYFRSTGKVVVPRGPFWVSAVIGGSLMLVLSVQSTL